MDLEPKTPAIQRTDWFGWVGRIGGPVVACLVFLSLDQFSIDIPDEAQVVASIGTLMAVFWITEAIPLAVTSLLPLILFPLTGSLSFPQAAAPYANPIIFLFMGGFMLATAISRWGLHRRIALRTVLLVGTSPRRLVGGFMAATALMSMWISNTAATLMMYPIAMSAISLIAKIDNREMQVKPGPNEAELEREGFGVCLLLGIAYSASIGGLATLIGTPPNAFLSGFLITNGVDLAFGRWLLMAFPLTVLLLVGAWGILVFFVYQVGADRDAGQKNLILEELRDLGAPSRGERVVGAVFVLTALGWIVRQPLTNWHWLVACFPSIENLNDAIVAMMGALSLFMIPIDAKRAVFALDWEHAKSIPWGVLILFGGGLSLAAATSSSGLTGWIGTVVADFDSLASSDANFAHGRRHDFSDRGDE